jgi:hypothetical protein
MSYKPNVVPIGTIISWSGNYFSAQNNGGVSSCFITNNLTTIDSYLLKRGFKICDGTEFYDNNSPIFNANGRFLPKITDDRFLMGSNTNSAIPGIGYATQNIMNFSFSNSTITTLNGSASFNKTILNTDQIGHYHSNGNLIARMENISNSATTYFNVGSTTSWTANRRINLSSAEGAATSNRSQAVSLQSGTNSTTDTIQWGTSTISMNFLNPQFNTTSLNNKIISWNNRPLYITAIYAMRVK